MFIVEIEKNLFEDVILKDTDSGVTAVITPEKGGMITSLIKNNRDYIYLDKEVYATESRGSSAVPVLFPTVGRTKDEVLIIDGQKYPMGIHGLVHSYKWDILSHSTDNGASVTIAVKSNEQSRKSYPFDFEVRLTFTLKSDCVTIDQEYINCSDKVMPFNFGFHPYFSISHAENLKFVMTAKDELNVDNDTSKPFTGEIDLPLAYKIGAIYTETNGKIFFEDTVDNIGVTVKYDNNFKYVVIWTNTKDKFICIEPWSSIPNALNTGIDVSKLNPHETLKAQYSIEIS